MNKCMEALIKVCFPFASRRFVLKATVEASALAHSEHAGLGLAVGLSLWGNMWMFLIDIAFSLSSVSHSRKDLFIWCPDYCIYVDRYLPCGKESRETLFVPLGHVFVSCVREQCHSPEALRGTDVKHYRHNWFISNKGESEMAFFRFFVIRVSRRFAASRGWF